MHGLPLQDLLPCLLVVVVVDFNDVVHIGSREVVVAPAPPASQPCDQHQQLEAANQLVLHMIIESMNVFPRVMVHRELPERQRDRRGCGTGRSEPNLDLII